MVDDRTRQDEPDPALVWRWFGRAAQPVMGWSLAILGLLAIGFAWFKLSNEVYVARQLPYLTSGGLVGLALVFFGGLLLGVQDVRRVSDRLVRLEALVADLHGALLTRADAPVAGVAPLTRSGDVTVLPNGTSFHRADCSIVTDKDGTTTMSAADATDAGLTPCKLCAPLDEGAWEPTDTIRIR